MKPRYRLRGLLGDRRGAAAIEFGLLFPVLIVLVIGVAEFGRAIYQHHTLSKALRDATRFMTRVPSPATNVTAQAQAANLALRGSLDTSAPLLLGPDSEGKVTVGFNISETTSATSFAGRPEMIEGVAVYAFEPVTGFAFTDGITIAVRHVERYIGE